MCKCNDAPKAFLSGDLNQEDFCFSSSILPFGWTKQDYPVRYGIEFKTFPGEINLSSELVQYESFAYNPSKKRISFRVQSGTAYRKQFSTDICSNDPKIKTFKSVFFASNPGLDKNNLNFYSFLDYEGDEKFLVKTVAKIKNGILAFVHSSGNLIETLGNLSPVLVWVLLAGGCYYAYEEYYKKWKTE